MTTGTTVSYYLSKKEPLPIPYSSLPLLRKTIEKEEVTGVNISRESTLEELVHSYGIPPSWVLEQPSLQREIIKTTPTSHVLVSSPHLQEFIINAQENLKDILEDVKDILPFKQYEQVRNFYEWEGTPAHHFENVMRQRVKFYETLRLFHYLTTHDYEREVATGRREYYEYLITTEVLPPTTAIDLLTTLGWTVRQSNTNFNIGETNSHDYINIQLHPSRTLPASKESTLPKWFIIESPTRAPFDEVAKQEYEAVQSHNTLLTTEEINACTTHYEQRGTLPLGHHGGQPALAWNVINAINKLREQGIIPKEPETEPFTPIITPTPILLEIRIEEEIEEKGITTTEPILEQLPETITPEHATSMTLPLEQLATESATDSTLSDHPPSTIHNPPTPHTPLPVLPRKERVIIEQGTHHLTINGELYQSVGSIEAEWRVPISTLEETVTCEEHVHVTLRGVTRYVKCTPELEQAIIKESTKTFNKILRLISGREDDLPERVWNIITINACEDTPLYELSQREGTPYDVLLKELQDAHTIARVIRKNMTPANVRRCLYEEGIPFIPLYELYERTGIPEIIAKQQHSNRILTIKEKGITLCAGAKHSLETNHQQLTNDYERTKTLLPPHHERILETILKREEHSENDYKQVLGYKTKTEMNRALVEATMIAKAIPETTNATTMGRYELVRDVAARLKTSLFAITQTTGASIITIQGNEYVSMPMMRGKEENERRSTGSE